MLCTVSYIQVNNNYVRKNIIVIQTVYNPATHGMLIINFVNQKLIVHVTSKSCK